jgi:hypothetical protein
LARFESLATWVEPCTRMSRISLEISHVFRILKQPFSRLNFNEMLSGNSDLKKGITLFAFGCLLRLRTVLDLNLSLIMLAQMKGFGYCGNRNIMRLTIYVYLLIILCYLACTGATVAVNFGKRQVMSL